MTNVAQIPPAIGPYQVLAQLGEGGMGVVYRARDTRLNRDVAIKVLPEAFALDAERLARFTREAQVLASLNHPNIAAIYGFEADRPVEAGSPAKAGRHLIMEFVDGEDLSQRIARGPMPLDEALPIARQIAEALEAAHEQGIIHRDLKPANIKVRADGTVKVLDFGLAKAIDPGAESRRLGADVANSPTITTPAMTMRGVILGTAAYMAPEQARGKAVDRRADTWAFGAVLFEMLTGRRAFDGEDISVTLANVIKEAPPWDALPAHLPSSLRRLLRRCLEKDPKKRLDSIHDARLDLDDAGTAEQTIAATAIVRTSRLAWAAAAIASATAIVLLVPAVQHWREIPPVLTESRLEIASPVNLDATNPTNFSISPDGRHVIFVGAGDSGNRLWLRSLDSTTVTPLGGTDRASPPFWSPDSRSIAFFADGLMKRLDLGAGAPRTITQAANSRGGTWNADGTIVFAPGINSPLFRVPSFGGDAVPVTTLTGDEAGHRFPFFLPDGRHFLYFSPTRSDLGWIHLGTLDSAGTTPLTEAATAGVYLRNTAAGGGARAPGWLLWERAGSLVAQHLDLGQRALTGAIVTVADSVARTSAGFRSAVAVSDTGLIGYRAGGDVRRQMTWLDRAGVVLGTMGPPDENDLRDPSLAPDGRRLAVSRRVQGNIDLWLLDGMRTTRLTFDRGPDVFPIWSPDGRQIVYRSTRSGVEDLYTTSLDNGRTEALLVESAENKTPTDWSRDGRFVLYHSGGSSNDVWVKPLQSGAPPSIVLKTPFNEHSARFSPDGRFVAYSSDESGRREVYVRPFTDPGAPASVSQAAPWQVSASGGLCPSWRDDGRELLFEGLDGRLMAVPITVRGTRLEAGPPVALFYKDHLSCANLVRQFDVARDGRLLVNVVIGAGETPITILQNWRPSQP